MTAQNTSQNSNALVALSDAMVAAVERASTYTVLVDARRRFPASGILYAEDLVLTADHVVEREEEIGVVLPNGTRVAATLAGRDPGSDLALLRLDTRAAAKAEKAPAEARIGQFALAVGRPSGEGLEAGSQASSIQASLGIISSTGGPVRTGRGAMLERYLATDAIPYPGFSGGPLVDAEGRVLGINTSGLTRGSSIAIPAGLAWQVAGSLSQFGRVPRGYLGIRSQSVELPAAGRTALGRDQQTGLLVMWVEDDSPAVKGGLMVGDILTALDGTPLENHDELVSRLTGAVVGKPVQIELLRGGQPAHLTVTVGEKAG